MVSELPLEIVERILRYSLPPLRFDRTPRREALRSYSQISYTWFAAVRAERRRNQHLQLKRGQRVWDYPGFGTEAATLRIGFHDYYAWEMNSYADYSPVSSSVDIDAVLWKCENLHRLYLANLSFVTGSLCFGCVASSE